MNHWLIAPVILPAFMGALIILWMRYDLLLQRVFGILGTLLTLGLALWLNVLAADGDVLVYRLGNWPAPFGIVLVLDRLAGLMLALTAFLALGVQLYGFGSGWDRKGWHFHALWQFQIMGLNGAFLTGDAFNLFVFFEVLLIASYGLMIHGGGPMRLRAGVQYVVYNLAGSTLFLAALGALYAVTGTLNMADMALRVAEMPDQDTALLRVGAVLLMLVFAVKAALFPLHFWLPSTYANAPGPSAALFAIMSKVGVYAIIRFFTIVFPQDTVIETLATDLLLPAALITLTLGQIGVLGTRSLTRLAAYAAIGSIGMLMIGVARFQSDATTAALYYLIHSTLAAGALFLVIDLIAARRGGDIWLRLRPAIDSTGIVSALFFITGIAIVGLPPLSGFLGKLMIMDATRADPWVVWIWSVILVTSVLALIGFARAGSILFWKAHSLDPEPGNDTDEGKRPPRGPIPTKLETDEPIQDVGDAASSGLAFSAVGLLLAGSVAMTIFAGPLMGYLQDTAGQLYQPTAYIDAVLHGQEGTKSSWRRLFPHPFLSLLLVAVWMLLVNRFAWGSLVFAIILAVVIPALTAPYWPDRPKARGIVNIAAYCLLVVWDIIVANVQVAMIVLFKPNRDLRPAWIVVPLDLTTPEAITVLAGTITLTPGTVSCDISQDGKALLVHGLHAPDPDAVRDQIKSRYEARLKEIFT